MGDLQRAVMTEEKIDAFPNRNSPDEPLILPTAPLVRGVTETPPSGKPYAMDNLRTFLSDSAFDPIRDRPDFPKPPYHTEA